MTTHSVNGNYGWYLISQAGTRNYTFQPWTQNSNCGSISYNVKLLSSNGTVVNSSIPVYTNSNGNKYFSFSESDPSFYPSIYYFEVDGTNTHNVTGTKDSSTFYIRNPCQQNYYIVNYVTENYAFNQSSNEMQIHSFGFSYNSLCGGGLQYKLTEFNGSALPDYFTFYQSNKTLYVNYTMIQDQNITPQDQNITITGYLQQYPDTNKTRTFQVFFNFSCALDKVIPNPSKRGRSYFIGENQIQASFYFINQQPNCGTFQCQITIPDSGTCNSSPSTLKSSLLTQDCSDSKQVYTYIQSNSLSQDTACKFTAQIYTEYFNTSTSSVISQSQPANLTIYVYNCVTLSIGAYNISNATYDVSQGSSQYIAYKNWSDVVWYCTSNINYTLLNSSGSTVTNPMYSSNSWGYLVNTQSISDVGVYDLTLKGCYLTNCDEKSFTLNVTNICGDKSNFNSQYIDKVGDMTYYTYNTTSVSFNRWSVTDPSMCGSYSDYQIQVSQSGTNITQPNFIVFNSTTRTFTFDSTSDSDLGSYNITVSAQTVQNLTHSYTYTLTVKKGCPENQITNTSIANQNIKHDLRNSSPIYIPIDWQHTLSYCSSVQFTISDLVGSLISSGVLAQSGTAIQSQGYQVSLLSSTPNQINITGSVENDTVTKLVNITFYDSCQDSSLSINSQNSYLQQPISYTVGKHKTLSYQSPLFVISPWCSALVNYTLTQPGYSSLPGFLTFNESAQQIGIYSVSKPYRKTYKLVLTGYFEKLDGSQAKASIDMTINIKASSSSQSQTKTKKLNSITLQPNITHTLQIDKLIDTTNLTFSSVDFGTATPFITGSYPTYSIKPGSSDLGSHQISIVFDSKSGTKYKYTIDLSVQKQSTSNTTSSSSSSTTSSSSTSNQGKSTAKLPDIEASITSISLTGLVKVQFTQSMLIPSNLSMIDTSVLQLSIQKGSSSPKFTWKVASYSHYLMEIQLNFANPLEVSQGTAQYLKIMVLKNKFFIDKDQKRIAYQYSMDREIPRQLSNDKMSQALQSNAGTVKSAIANIAMGTFAINILMAASISLLWNLINVVQMIIYMPLLNLNFPPNATFFYTIIVNLSQMQVIPQGTAAKFLNISRNKNMPQNFQYPILTLQRFGNQSIILNINDTFFYVLFFIPLYAFLFLMKPFSKYHKWIYQVNEWIDKKMFFGFIFRFFFESFLEVTFSAFLNAVLMEWNTKSDYFNNIFALVFAALAIVFPTFILLKIQLNFRRLQDEDFERRYGTLYENARVDARYSVITGFLQMFRRLLFGVQAMFLQDYPYFQIQLVVLQSILMLTFIALVRPFKRRILNIMEFFNETCILLCSYHLFLFTDFEDNYQLQYDLGWSMSAIVVLAIVVNMIFILTETMKKVILNIKHLCAKYRQWREMKKVKKYQGEFYEAEPLNSSAKSILFDQSKPFKKANKSKSFVDTINVKPVESFAKKAKKQKKSKSKRDIQKRRDEVLNLQNEFMNVSRNEPSAVLQGNAYWLSEESSPEKSPDMTGSYLGKRGRVFDYSPQQITRVNEGRREHTSDNFETTANNVENVFTRLGQNELSIGASLSHIQ